MDPANSNQLQSTPAHTPPATGPATPPAYPSDLVTPRQAAAILGFHPDVIRRWARAGRFPTYGASRRVLVSMSEVLNRRVRH